MDMYFHPAAVSGDTFFAPMDAPINAAAMPVGVAAFFVTNGPAIFASSNMSPAGVLAGFQVGTLSSSASAVTSVMGNAGAATVGQILANGAVSIEATPVGIVTIGNIGTAAVKADAFFSTIGLSANAFSQQVEVTGEAQTTPSQEIAYGSVGNAVAVEVTAAYRALISSGKYLKQISDAEVNTGLKPIVLFEGVQQPRKENEGIPIVLIDGNLHTLPNGANLIL